MRASGRRRFLRRWSSPKAATSSTSGVTAALHRPGACSVYRPRAVAINPAVMLSADSGRDDVPVGGGSWLSSRAFTGARGRSGRCGRPLCWPTDCARRRSPDRCRVPHRPAIRAFRRRELDRRFSPSLRSSTPSDPSRSVPARAVLEAEVVARPSLRSSGFAVSAELVRPMARRSGIGRLAGAATRFMAVARRGVFGGAPPGGERRSGRST